MNLTPPTDSFYKFTAIVGSVIVILSFYLPDKIISSYEQQIIDRRLKAKIVKLELNGLGKSVKVLQNIIDDNIARNKKGYKLDPTKIHLYYSDTEIKQLVKQINSELTKIEIKEAEVDSIEEKLTYTEKELHRMRIFLIIGSLLGYCLAVYGYVNWYKKIQVYQDRILRQSAEEATIKKE